MLDWELLARRFLLGEHGDTLEELAAADFETTRQAARSIGEQLRQDALTHWHVWPRERTWIDHQDALVALAALPAVEEPALAEALIDACSWQNIRALGSPLNPHVFAWLMRCAPQYVYEAVADDRLSNPGFLKAALWAWPDPDARAWMLELFRRRPFRAQHLYDRMRAGSLRSAWDDEEWNRRVHLLCEADLPAPPFRVGGDLPPTTSAAQVRFACVYARSGTDPLLRAVAENLSHYRSGIPSVDVDLVWWDVDDAHAPLLRTLLEAAGPAGARAPLVEAALAAEVVGPEPAAFLRAPLPRPAWMDGDVPWEVHEVVDAGVVHVPDGRLGAGDPYSASEGVPCLLEVPPGHHPLRLTFTTHPLIGRACAVAELVIDPATPPSCWERLRSGPGLDEFGYRVEVGVGSFGAAEALTRAPFHDLAPTDFAGSELASFAHVDAGGLGSIVMFHVLPQDQLCRTWVGRAPDGSVVRVVSDLGILHLDPDAHPDEPLRPGPPPPEEPNERVPTALERESGLFAGQRYLDSQGGDGETATILWLEPASASWLRAPSVWYRWDRNRAGELRSIAEFRRRFVAV